MHIIPGANNKLKTTIECYFVIVSDQWDPNIQMHQQTPHMPMSLEFYND